jgi:hypothetical protein
MNWDFVLFNLKEAHEALGLTIKEIESDTAYGYGEFSVAMMHIYHHLNTAWNAQAASEEEARAGSRQDFARWSPYPADLAPLGSV